jgi:peptidoglycan/xylan/chitin deacetylase (PgdA/CDA1 family)
MYHGVTLNNTQYFSPRHVFVSDFEKEIAYYKHNFDVISIDEAFNRIKNNDTFGRKTITISFDDGFANNLNVALPILEKYDVPVTFFISSVCAENDGSRVLWPEFIAALKYFSIIDKTKGTSLGDSVKAMPYQERDAFLDSIDKEHKVLDRIHSLPDEIWKLLDKRQLIELSNSGIVTIGSHGHNHYNLGQIEPEYAKFELERSKDLLESAIQKKVKYIAYPDGSYNESVKDMAEKAGYLGQMAVKYKLPEDETDRRIMDRFGISATTTFESNILFLSKSFK